jgi:hypothetical protein
MGKGWKDDGKRDRKRMEKKQKRDGKETEEGWLKRDSRNMTKYSNRRDEKGKEEGWGGTE